MACWLRKDPIFWVEASKEGHSLLGAVFRQDVRGRFWSNLSHYLFWCVAVWSPAMTTGLTTKHVG